MTPHSAATRDMNRPVTSRSVFLLWHTYDLGGDEESKLLGVYSTEERARMRTERARLAPGFSEYPDAFLIDQYEVDHDEWREGFVTA